MADLATELRELADTGADGVFNPHGRIAAKLREAADALAGCEPFGWLWAFDHKPDQWHFTKTNGRRGTNILVMPCYTAPPSIAAAVAAEREACAKIADRHVLEPETCGCFAVADEIRARAGGDGGRGNG